MSKHKRKEMRISGPSTQLFITDFTVEGERPREIVLEELPEIKLETVDKDEERKITLEFEDKEKERNRHR